MMKTPERSVTEELLSQVEEARVREWSDGARWEALFAIMLALAKRLDQIEAKVEGIRKVGYSADLEEKN